MIPGRSHELFSKALPRPPLRATSSVRESVLHSVCFTGVTSGMDSYTTEVKVPNTLSLIKVSGCNAAGIVTFIGAVGRKLTR